MRPLERKCARGVHERLGHLDGFPAVGRVARAAGILDRAVWIRAGLGAGNERYAGDEQQNA
jgi:hypothetical protein